MDPEPHPEVFRAEPEPWAGSWHALCAAAAAAGSGAEWRGKYSGVAPEADLFLIAMYFPGQKSNPEKRYVACMRALEWVRENWRKYEIRAVMAARVLRTDSGLLPWQMEPLRVLCEELAAEGVLVTSGTGNVPDRTAAVTQAAAPSVLSVGGIAVPPDGDLSRAATFQGCRGTTYEGKWVPEILAPAENIVLPQKTDDEAQNHLYAKIDDLPRRYARTNGTSFSGPIVLGACACLWQANPDWTASEMKATLIAASQTQPQWSDLHAGLVSVHNAMASGPMEVGPAIAATSPYQDWPSWRRSAIDCRLGKLNSSNPAAVRYLRQSRRLENRVNRSERL